MQFRRKYSIIGTRQTKENRKTVHVRVGIMYPHNHQMTLEDIDFSFETLDFENEWVKLSALVPWDIAGCDSAPYSKPETSFCVIAP